VVGLDAGGIVVDDGTARGRVALAGEAAAYLPLIEPDDAINVTGRVVLAGGRVEVSVTDPAGLLRVGDLGEPIALESADPPGLVSTGALDRIQPGAGRPETAAAAGGLAPPTEAPRSAGLGLAAFQGPVGLGVAWLALASIASLAMAGLRRHRHQRGLASRIAERLAALGAPDGPRAT